jgi:hypothetical protein
LFIAVRISTHGEAEDFSEREACDRMRHRHTSFNVQRWTALPGITAREE